MKFALCNEVLQPLPFAAQCKLAADLGYDGLEVAPFTLAEDPTELTDAEVEGYRRTAEDHGLKIFGLHWLLVAPAGLSIVSSDAALRQRTKAVMARLVELCAALGGSYLVHGSPKQRSVPADSTREQAWERARECLSGAAAAAARCGVTYCLEPLSRRETDLFNTVEECVRMLEEIGEPALRTMIDCSAAGQTEAWAVQHGDVDTAASLLTFAPEERAKLEAVIAALPENLREQYGTPERLMAMVMAGTPRPIAGVQILQEKEQGPDDYVQQVQLKYADVEPVQTVVDWLEAR